MLFGKKSGAYDYIIAGLGNPGAKYEMTRHNAGFLAIDMLAMKQNKEIKRLKFHALTCDAEIEGKKCLLMKPQTGIAPPCVPPPPPHVVTGSL